MADVTADDLVDLLPTAFGVLLMSAEAVGVSRSIAASDGYAVDVDRDLLAMGASNIAAGLSPGFVQSGGASQTMAAEQAGGKTQVASIIAAGLNLLTGAFLAPLFADLPQATLGAIVVVAIAGFYRVDELKRFARLRRSALIIALVALIGVLSLGVLPGLVVAARLSLAVVIKRLSRPPVGVLARYPSTGAWGQHDRHPEWEVTDDFLVARVEGPLFYANAMSVKEHLLALTREQVPSPRFLVLDLSASHDLDVESVDVLGGLATELAQAGIELRLASVRIPVLTMLRRAGLTERVRVEPTIDAAIQNTTAHSTE